MMRLWDIAPNRDKGAVKDDLSFLGIIPVKFKPLYVSDEDGNRLINFYKTHTPEAIREMKREARCLTRFGAKNNSCTAAWRENHPDLVCLKDLAEILCRDRRTLYSVLRLHNFETRMVDGQRCISASILPDVKAALFCACAYSNMLHDS